MPRRKRKSAKSQARFGVSEKISKLRHEGEPQDKAVAMALSMKRAGRLTPKGGYIRSGRKKSRRAERRY